jgi:hypothetical protein
MLVPTLMIQLNKSNTGFRELSRKQTICSVGPGHQTFRTVQLDDVIRFLRQVRQFRHRGLHPVSHFILLYLGFDLGVAKFLIRQAIQLSQVVKHSPPAVLVNPVWIIKI